MAEKKEVSPKLNYRIEKEIQEAYRQVCEENCLQAGRLIRQFMLDTIKKYEKTEKNF